MIKRQASSISFALPEARAGVTTLETAFIMPVFLTIVIGMLELAIAIFQFHVVSQSARHGAREAIVHGELAPPELDEWSPVNYSNPHTVAANSNDTIAVAVRRYMVGLDLSQTTITVNWLDGDAEIDSRVRVRVSANHQPITTFLFTAGWTFVAESTMPIAH